MLHLSYIHADIHVLFKLLSPEGLVLLLDAFLASCNGIRMLFFPRRAGANAGAGPGGGGDSLRRTGVLT